MSSPCPQCPSALPGGAEEATTESHQEDQHLHRHLYALLCSLCHHAVSAGGRSRWGGWESDGACVCVCVGGFHPGTMPHTQPFIFLLTTPTSSLPPLHADLAIGNMPPPLRRCCHISASKAQVPRMHHLFR